MRWLLAKDLRILRRSPLLVGLLCVYPVAVALMIGFALSSPPGKPKVAILNEVPPGQGGFSVGSEKIDVDSYAKEFNKSIVPIKVSDRAEAVRLVRSGRALAAIVIPADLATKLSTGISQPTIEVVLNDSDPLQKQFVDQTIKSRLADANQALSGQFTKVAGQDISLLLTGGDFNLLGQKLNILGLRRSGEVLKAVQKRLPPGSPARAQVGEVIRFAQLAGDNLNLATDVLKTVADPIRVKRTELSGHTTPADAYAVSIAVTVSLMFVGLLLAAGMLALEREENTWARLVRGLVSRSVLLAEKALLAGGLAALAGIVLSAGIGIFFSLHWSRFPAWVAALALAGLAFGALGVALGALAREVRAASLLAFGLALPMAFLALVPPSAVSGSLHSVLDAISAVFPFRPSLQAIDSALNGASSPALGISLLHLAVLTAVFGGLARLAVRRF
jgi:ABC-type multidrug transport system permease subunit